MTRLRVLLARLHGMATGRARDAALEVEVQTHLDLLTDEYLRAGLPAQDARMAARRAFGGALQTREAHRDERTWGFASHLACDLWLAVRRARSEPRVLTIIALTIGLGVGANAAMLDAANRILFRSLSVPRASEVVSLYNVDRQTGRYVGTSYSDFQEFARLPALQGLALYMRLPLGSVEGNHLRTMPGELVTPNYFSLLEVTALVGTTFDPQRQAADWPLVAMMGEDTWRERFAADPGVVGRTIDLDGRSFTVVGVVPRSFGLHNLNWLGRPAFWIPLDSFEQLHVVGGLSRREIGFLTLGRLRPGATLAQAQEQADVVARRLAAEAPDTNGHLDMTVFPAGQAKFYPGFRPTVEKSLSAFVVATGFIFLLACCNLITVVSHRNLRRQRELAVRLSLGGSRGRIVQQLLAEGFVFALPGFALALAAAAGVQHVVNAFPQMLGTGMALELSISWPVIVLAMLFSLAMAALLAVPALRLHRADVVRRLKDDHRTMTGSQGASLRTLAVAAQVVVAAALSAGSLLVFRSLLTNNGAEVGFDRSHLLTISFGLRPGADRAEGRGAVLAVARSLTQIPSVLSASTVSFPPLDGRQQRIMAGIPGEAPLTTEAAELRVGSSFFATAGIAILQGRALDEKDRLQGSGLAVISASLAHRFWPNAEAIGQTILLAQGRAAPQRVQVVGVARDVRYSDPWGDRRLFVYRLDEPPAPYLPALLLKTSGPAILTLADVHRGLATLPEGLLLTLVRTADTRFDQMLRPQRAAGVFLGVIAGLAMLVAGIGLHHTLGYTVEQRRREIAVRIAVGGSPVRVSAQILRRPAVLALGAAVAGTITSTAFTPLLATQAKGMPAHDAATFLTVGAVLLVGCMALAACSIARGARINLSQSLRLE